MDEKSTNQSRFIEWMMALKNIYLNDTERMDRAINSIPND